ncbi:alpha-L-arabinofuranosidase C-terminal domain-containing protein [Parapedobacter soli]|uniref:alpha-L-arabinofuranosidase C-terminal domain-containing protein n=1 Tax=Parapedobacter soli TaxID=416955 RepID=UPI0021C6686A|nr:alpha-L-arabinofuranosidase C-terminal domain-containing protein [Parapedobacter soli]
MKGTSYIIIICFVAISVFYAGAQERIFDIAIDRPIGEVSPQMWGVFFEDINLGADGGIYAELVKNRSFEFFRPMMGWHPLGAPVEGALLVLNRQEHHAKNPRFLRVNTMAIGSSGLGLGNEGFRGMGVKAGVRYDFSIMYRQHVPGISLRLELVDSAGIVIGAGRLEPAAVTGGWQQQITSFHATATHPKARLNIWFEGNGEIDLDMISLFPADTWQGRPGGLRADMVQLLADMEPGFLRFPGGCIVEGYDLSQRFQWKKTVGPVEERQMVINRWNFEFKHRPTPDYFQTFGLGFFEYFQLAEDIGAEPLPIINCGMACQFNTAEVVPLDQLDTYVQDALDLIEFANGDTTTTWGRLRADMGHPEPFNLKMIGIGNENWGPQYVERLAVFQQAMKNRHPEIAIVASSGTDPNGDRFNYLDSALRNLGVDIIDEHYYRPPQWFFDNAARYDNYDRNGPRIFAGEYAAQSVAIASPDNKNNWLTALSEAAFLTGLERNADIVTLASYAPLFGHVDGWQWTPDLIWVDNLTVYGTPNYYVQKLYSTNKGTHIVQLTEKGDTVAGQRDLFASAVVDKKTNELIIKVVNRSDYPIAIQLELSGADHVAQTAVHVEMRSDDLDTVNSIEAPLAVSPQEREIVINHRSPRVEVSPYSFNVFRFKI